MSRSRIPTPQLPPPQHHPASPLFPLHPRDAPSAAPAPSSRTAIAPSPEAPAAPPDALHCSRPRHLSNPAPPIPHVGPNYDHPVNTAPPSLKVSHTARWSFHFALLRRSLYHEEQAAEWGQRCIPNRPRQVMPTTLWSTINPVRRPVPAQPLGTPLLICSQRARATSDSTRSHHAVLSSPATLASLARPPSSSFVGLRLPHSLRAPPSLAPLARPLGPLGPLALSPSRPLAQVSP